MKVAQKVRDFGVLVGPRRLISLLTEKILQSDVGLGHR